MKITFKHSCQGFVFNLFISIVNCLLVLSFTLKFFIWKHSKVFLFSLFPWQYWMLSKTGEIRRDEACLDFAGSDVILYPCHGGKGNQVCIIHLCDTFSLFRRFNNFNFLSKFFLFSFGLIESIQNSCTTSLPTAAWQSALTTKNF